MLGYANGAAELLDLPVRLTADDFTVHDQYVGERYGVVTAAGLEALRLAGRSEGLILDPVYTAKAMSGLIDQIGAARSARTKPSSSSIAAACQSPSRTARRSWGV